MKKPDINQMFNGLRGFKLGRLMPAGLFFHKVAAAMVIAVAGDLKLLNVDYKEGNKITAFKIVSLPVDKKDTAILEAIANFIKENNILHKNVIFSPDLKSAVIKRLRLPVVPEKEIIQTIRWQVKDDLSFDLSRAVIDYQVIGRQAKEDGSQIMDIICLAADYDEIKAQVILLKQLGLNCVSVSLPAFGYAALMQKHIFQDSREDVAILELNEDGSSIAIYKNNRLDFYRQLPASIAKMKDALSAEISTETSGRIRLTGEEIDANLFKFGVPLESQAIYADKMAAGQIRALLRPFLERLSQEIKRSLVYYTSQFQGSQVKKIAIAGEAVKILNLDKFLSGELSLSVSNLASVSSLASVSKLKQEGLAEAYACFGLSLDFKNNINILPLEFKTEKIEMLQKVSLRWVFFIAFLLLFISFVFAAVEIGLEKKRLNNEMVYLNVLSEVKEIKAKIDEYYNLASRMRNADAPAGEILKKISNVVSPELFFDNLNINYESKTGTITGFIINTKSNPETILSMLTKGLASCPYFKDIDISSVENTAIEGSAAARFQLNFNLI